MGRGRWGLATASAVVKANIRSFFVEQCGQGGETTSACRLRANGHSRMRHEIDAVFNVSKKSAGKLRADECRAEFLTIEKTSALMHDLLSA